MFCKWTYTYIKRNMVQKKFRENCNTKPLLYHFDNGIIFIDMKTNIGMDLMNAEITS